MKRLTATLLLLSALSGIAIAEPPTTEPAAERQIESDQPKRLRGEKDSAKQADTLRQRLEDSIARGEQQLERNREALAALENGESPTAVLRKMRSREVRIKRVNFEPRERDPEDARPPARREHLDSIYAFIQEHIPELHAQLEKMAQIDEQAPDQIIMRLAPRIDAVIQTFLHDEEFGQLKLDELRAGLRFVHAMREYRSLSEASEDERASALGQLRIAAADRFDARMKLREHEVNKLAEQLVSLTVTIQEMRESRDQEIEDMVNASKMPERARHQEHSHKSQATD